MIGEKLEGWKGGKVESWTDWRVFLLLEIGIEIEIEIKVLKNLYSKQCIYQGLKNSYLGT